MFRKRIKKTFPEGTFIPTNQRVMAIIQLCLALTALLFLASKPFMQDHFALKSDSLVYDYVLGKNNEQRLEYFHQLQEPTKETILLKYKILLNAFNVPFHEKLQSSIYTIFFKSSIYERAWILFGIVIPIMLLKKREGAKHAAWILPLIVVAFLISNANLKNQTLSEEMKLYPSEDMLVTNYLNAPLSNYSYEEQQKLLLKAWHSYLVENYTKEIPATNQNVFKNQVAKGEHAFHAAKLLKMPESRTQKTNDKQSTFLMTAYLLWNLLFAYISSTRSKYKKEPLQKIQEAPAN